MSKRILLMLICCVNIITIFGQCKSVFSVTIFSETVTFTIHSKPSDAHFFWNFGDGTGSNFENPTHKYPANGNYLVTLFSRDTITGCHSYYEKWININISYSEGCQPLISDSLFVYNNKNFLKIIDKSKNCDGFTHFVDGGPALNQLPNSWISLDGAWKTIGFHMVCRVQIYSYDNINGYQLFREAYKTSLYNYPHPEGFDDCSSNFEFTVISQDSTGQRVLFESMNKTASNYEWYISGFGNPITSDKDTISKFYPFSEIDLWHVGLMIEGSSGCHDTLYQNILVRDDISTINTVAEIETPLKYSLSPNPFINQTTLSLPTVIQSATMDLFDSNGQIVKQINITQGGKIVINRGNLSSGLYYFIVTDQDQKLVSGKLVVE